MKTVSTSHGKYNIHSAPKSLGGGVHVSYRPKGDKGRPQSGLPHFPDAKAAMAAIQTHHAKMSGGKSPTKLTKKSLYLNTNQGEAMESFEDIFKSEDSTCESCGHVLEKGMKSKGKKSKVGNEKDPHKGGKTGSFVNHARTGMGAGPVDKESAKRPHAPKTGVVKAMFPVNGNPRLATYGLSEDNALSKSIEAMNNGEAHNLFTPPMRNMAMEQESSRSNE